MASSLVKVALFLFFGSLTSALPNVNSQLHKRDLLIANNSTLPGKWQSYGCYLDGAATGRTLSGAGYANGTAMTEESCISFCDSQGYYYAGLEYSDECYCGNGLYPNTPEPNTDCQMPCAGNTTEACGGPNRLNVFWSGKTPPPAPVTNNGPPGWSLLGCYTEGTTGRTLQTGMGVTGQMTVGACTYACKMAGYTFAGVEYSQECYCDMAISNGGLLAPNGISDCNMICKGNSSEFCGAGNRLDVYELTSLIPTSSSVVVSSTTTSTTSSSSTSTTTSTTTTSSPASSSTSSSSSTTTTSSPSSSSTSSSSTSTTSSSISSTKSGTTTTSSSTSSSSSTKTSTLTTSTPTSKTSTTSTTSSKSSTTSSTSSSKSSTTSTTKISTTSTSSTKSSTTSTTKSSTTSTLSTKSSTTTTSSTSSSKTSTTSATSTSSTSSSSKSSTTSSTSATSTSSSSSSTSPTTSTTSTTSQTSSSSSIAPTTSTTSSTSSISTSSPSSSSTSTSSSSFSSTSSSKSTSTFSSTSSSSTSSTSSSSSSSSSTTSTSATPTPTGPVHVANIAGYAWIGCVTEGTNSRALIGSSTTNYTSMTIEMCQAFCSSPTVYQYFGVEYAGECYCGNALQAGSIGAPTSDCSMICDGSPYEFCGAGNRLDLYKLGGSNPSSTSSSVTSTNTAATTGTTVSSSSSTTTSAASTSTPSGWKYDGCYLDGYNGRILRNGAPDSQSNSVESCINYCASNGYTIAGMEFSTQCFCDTAIYNGGTLATNQADCNMACSGNPAEMCGAGNRLSVYNVGNLTVYQAPAVQTGGIGNWTYQGCYTDNVNQNRALFWQIILPNTNSASTCLGLCQEYGYMSAGMEYGEECYCGDKSSLLASGSTLRPDSECNDPCPGNATAICGGGNRISYYEYTNGSPLYNWATPSGNAAGQYQFFVPGVVVPLMVSLAINNKVTFLEKHGTGAPNTTGAYELDLTLSNDFNHMWREMHLQTDVFCSGGLTLPDKGGRQLTVGGWAGASNFGVRLYWPDGSAGVNGTHDWQENENELSLQTPRWYPSNMMMSNGSILVTGGEVGSNAAANPTLEILPKPAGGYVKYLDWLDRTSPNNLYPFMFVMPKTGAIFAAYYNEARLLDPSTLDTTIVLPNMPGSVANSLAGRTYPLEGTAVMLPQHAPYTDDAVMLICGGSANGAALAIDNCVSIAPESSNPQWTIERMPSQRVMTCITALPDGTYLILNGAQGGVAGFGLGTNPNLGAVLYDPSKAPGFRMSIMATTIVARLYHSEAILLPDGSVLVSGSDPQDGTHPEEYRIEKFLLPYNLNGMAPPTFTIANTDWAWGGSYPITITSLPTANYGNMKISLIGAVSSTHGNSMGSKVIFPAFSVSGTTVTITAPPNGYVSPPGWFQLFVLDNGTPSFSTWVRIGGDPASLGNWPALPDFIVPGV